MSKIPLAHEESSDGNPSSKGKSFWKDIIIGSIIVAVMAIGVALAVYFYLISFTTPERSPKIVFHILADAFSVSGMLGLLFYLMTYVTSKGAFDMLSYSIQYVFLITFRREYKKENFPKTYYDYKVLKDREERKAYLGLLYPGLIFFAIGIIFLIIYMNV